jgi:hypothetical protein
MLNQARSATTDQGLTTQAVASDQSGHSAATPETFRSRRGYGCAGTVGIVTSAESAISLLSRTPS